MEATYSSETSVGFQWTTRRYFLEDRLLLSVYCLSDGLREGNLTEEQSCVLNEVSGKVIMVPIVC
jgi:hypothetical protein